MCDYFLYNQGDTNTKMVNREQKKIKNKYKSWN